MGITILVSPPHQSFRSGPPSSERTGSLWFTRWVVFSDRPLTPDPRLLQRGDRFAVGWWVVTAPFRHSPPYPLVTPPPAGPRPPLPSAAADSPAGRWPPIPPQPVTVGGSWPPNPLPTLPPRKSGTLRLADTRPPPPDERSTTRSGLLSLLAGE